MGLLPQTMLGESKHILSTKPICLNTIGIVGSIDFRRTYEIQVNESIQDLGQNDTGIVSLYCPTHNKVYLCRGQSKRKLACAKWKNDSSSHVYA